MASDANQDSPHGLVDAAIAAAQVGDLTPASALRLVFIIRKAWSKGYAWWKRAKLAKAWRAHPTTITRDCAAWTRLGFVKIRRNPFKRNANILVFPWATAWDDAIWDDPEKVASALPDLAKSFCKRRTHTTDIGGAHATNTAPPSINENPKQKDKKTHTAAAPLCVQENDPCDEESSSPGAVEDPVEVTSRIVSIFDEHRVRTRPGQVQVLIERGRARGLTDDGVLAFVKHKLQAKLTQGDPVYSAQLFVMAIDDSRDLCRFATECFDESNFEPGGSLGVLAGLSGGRKKTEPPFKVDAVCAFVARNAGMLREKGRAEIAEMLEALDVDALYKDLEQLEQRLTGIEEKMMTTLRAAATKEILAEARCALDADLNPYRGKMSAEQLAMLEKQFLERRLLEAAGLPRLSLFYL